MFDADLTSKRIRISIMLMANIPAARPTGPPPESPLTSWNPKNAATRIAAIRAIILPGGFPANSRIAPIMARSPNRPPEMSDGTLLAITNPMIPPARIMIP